MSLLRELMEQQGQAMVYANGWNTDSGFEGWQSSDMDGETYEDSILIAQDDYGVQGSETAPGIWIGINFDDAEFGEDADEDGPYSYENMTGRLIIVTKQPLPENHPIFKKAMREFEVEAKAHLEDERAGDQESREYQRDPYAYHGFRRSDFF